MAELDILLEKYRQDLIGLDLPSFYESSSNYSVPKVSPIVNKLKLARINDEFTNIRTSQDLDLDSRKLVISQLQSLLDEKLYINNKLTELWVESLDQTSMKDSTSDDNQHQKKPQDVSTTSATGAAIVKENDLSLLRKRLLSNSNTSMLDKTNDYHETIQEDILQELTGFAQSLRSSALKLSSKIVEDAQILEKTNENLLKNSNLMGLIDKNLNSYVLNKTGGKISFWFLIKVLAGIFVAFFFMVALIKIFPKM